MHRHPPFDGAWAHGRCARARVPQCCGCHLHLFSLGSSNVFGDRGLFGREVLDARARDTPGRLAAQALSSFGAFLCVELVHFRVGGGRLGWCGRSRLGARFGQWDSNLGPRVDAPRCTPCALYFSRCMVPKTQGLGLPTCRLSKPI